VCFEDRVAELVHRATLDDDERHKGEATPARREEE
jgi:hypothetical protein